MKILFKKYYDEIVFSTNPVILYRGNQSVFHEMILAGRKKKDCFFPMDGNKFLYEKSMFREAEKIFGYPTGYITNNDVLCECFYGMPYSAFCQGHYENFLLVLHNAGRILQMPERSRQILLSILNSLDYEWNRQFINNYAKDLLDDIPKSFGTEYYRRFYKSVLLCSPEQCSALEHLLQRSEVLFSVLPELI